MAYIPPLNGGRLNASLAGTNTAGVSTLISTGTMYLAGGNNITLSQNGASITISGANAPSGSINFSAGGNSANLSAVTFANSNGVSFGLNGSVITASAAGGGDTLSMYGLGNITQNSSASIDARSVSLNALGAMSVGYSNGSVQLSAPAVSSLSGAGAVTLSSNGNTINIGAPAQTNQTLGMTFTGNTTQVSAATVDARSLTFNGLGNVSVGYSNGSIQISGSGGGGNGGVAISNSQTSYSSGTVKLVEGGGAITIASAAGSAFNFSVPQTSSLSASGGLSIATNGSTISIGVPLMQQWIHNSAAMYASATSGMANASVSVVRMLIPEQMSFSRVDFPVSVGSASSAVANTAAMALSAVGVIYSRNGSTLNPIVGQSSTTTYSYASNTGAWASITGPRLMSFNLATTLSAGEYYLGVQLSSAASSMGTATTSFAGWTIAPYFGSTFTDTPWQDMMGATASSINPYQPLQGINTVSISNTSQTMQQSQIIQTGTHAVRANLIVGLRNTL